MMLKLAVWSVAIMGSLSVFALYARPEFLLTLANQMWSCF